MWTQSGMTLLHLFANQFEGACGTDIGLLDLLASSNLLGKVGELQICVLQLVDELHLPAIVQLRVDVDPGREWPHLAAADVASGYVDLAHPCGFHLRTNWSKCLSISLTMQFRQMSGLVGMRFIFSFVSLIGLINVTVIPISTYRS